MQEFIRRRLAITIVIYAMVIYPLLCSSSGRPSISILCVSFFWLAGVIYAATHYISMLERHLDSILKIGLISFLAVGKGTVSLVILVIYALYVFTIGWLYGLYMLVFDIMLTIRLYRR